MLPPSLFINPINPDYAPETPQLYDDGGIHKPRRRFPEGALDKRYTKVYVWGCNRYGQLGLGDDAPANSLYPCPIRGHEAIDRAHDVQVALGGAHMVILCNKVTTENSDMEEIVSSRVFSCGRASHGQLGVDTKMADQLKTPTLVDWWGADSEVHLTAEEEKQGMLRVPKIKTIAAGEYSTMAVQLVGESDAPERIYAWGVLPGLLNQPENVPKRQKIFEAEQLRMLLQTKNRLNRFKILNIALGKNHSLLLCEADRSGSTSVVIAWGDTKYGKLGIGNIPEFLEARAKQEKENRTIKAQSSFDTGSSFVVAPAVVALLDSSHITQVSAFSEHSMAISKTSGSIYSYVNR